MLLAAAATLTPINLQAQNSISNTNDVSQPVRSTSSLTNFFHTLHPQTSVSLGTFAQLTPTRVHGASQYILQTNGIAPTAGVFGTFRQQFRPWLGYSVNMGYTRVNERYTYGAAAPWGYDLRLPNNMYELSLSYTASKQLSPRMSGFLELGGGTVVFLPVIPASRQPYPGSTPQNALYYAPVNFRPEGVAGFGIHLHLADSFGLRLQYRGLIYKDPDFGRNLQKATTITSEPTVSLTYSFGHK